jgi:hypothetical protein
VVTGDVKGEYASSVATTIAKTKKKRILSFHHPWNKQLPWNKAYFRHMPYFNIM